MSKVTSSTTPFCRWCAKPLKKITEDHYFGYKDDRSGLRSVYHKEKPKSREEAARFANGKMVAIRYDKDGTVYRATFWDGESYYARFEHFDKIECAAALGRSVVPHGWASSEYHAKVKAQANEQQ